MKVGKNEQKEVTVLNAELYAEAVSILENGTRSGWHIGWGGVGDFIDWLEANYEIKKKDT